MFEHLTGVDPNETPEPEGEVWAEGILTPKISDEPAEPVKRASAQSVFNAQNETAQWLENLGGDDDLLTEAERRYARETFGEITVGSLSEEQLKARVLMVKAPKAVRHLSALLSAYDWEFVEQANQMRAYIVAQLLEDSRSKHTPTRLRALQMLGNVSEVGLFSTKLRVERTEAPKEEDVDDRIRAKLTALREVTDLVELQRTPPPPPVKMFGNIPDPEYVHFEEKPRESAQPTQLKAWHFEEKPRESAQPTQLKATEMREVKEHAAQSWAEKTSHAHVDDE